MQSVHDNFLLSYQVDAENKTICLRTKYLDGEREERTREERTREELTDVVFSGVAAYHFEADNLMTILFDVEESTLEATYRKHRSLFERLKNYGWPNTECANAEQLLETMRESGVRAYEISSSLGLEGFVWAREMEIRSAN